MATEVTTYNVIGTREDLSDLIKDITPTDAPFQKMCRKGSASNTLVEWQTDALASASAANAAVEGDDAPTAEFTPTVRQKNWTQILTKAVKVRGTADVTNKAGRGKEMAYQLVKKTKEIKRDLEASLTQNGIAVAGDATTARKFKGLECWIGDNQSLGAAGSPVAPNPEGAAHIGTVATDGTAEAFTETRLKAVLQSAYTAGGNPDVIMAGPGNRAVFSTFDGVSSAQNLDVNSGKIMGTMSVYESDWGTLKVVPNRFQRNRTVFVLESGGFEIATLRPLQTIDIAKTGDSDIKQLLMEVTLKVDNWHAHGAVRDCT